MTSLLDQLRDELPTTAHRRRVFLSADLAQAKEIAKRVRDLNLKSIRYVMSLERFEERPSGDKQAAYDLLVAALNEVLPKLSSMSSVERSYEKSED